MALEDIKNARLAKLRELRKAGIDPYPAVSHRTISVAEALERFDTLADSNEEVILSGRIMAKREHGGSAFFDINDGGTKIQAFIKEDVVGAEQFKQFQDFFDIGDFIEVAGTLFKTKKEERTVEVKHFMMLTKSLLPLPEKWHGLQDTEERFRKRYLDLIFNEDVRKKFQMRFKTLDLVREFFRERGYMEVETPVLQSMPGGATARPFKTHLNALDMDLYLRVAPELYLKRLLVGGFDKVFEIAKNFRNEGMDREHNPEFDMLEAYAAYQNYEDYMNMAEDLLVFLVRQLFDSDEIHYGGHEISVQKPFKRIEFNQVIMDACGLDYDQASEDDFRAKAKELGVVIEKTMSKGVIADEIYKKVARPNMINPTFVINHPLELSPLTKKLPDNPEHVARFQLLIGGFELMNAFSELNDPQDQLERFQGQEKLRKKGDEEAQRLDEDFIEALEYGMPPAAGIGIGLDRLIALLTDSHSLREILLFPTMRNKEK
ncbi:MAG TPA: lysine--tRNA ligase [Candidatus Paceibacterota bacterium]|nr:lysine--tRNA ligase [Candidatus Paceibacterota bacterium]